MDASNAAVVQLFEPKNLQVRTDVPLADAGRLRVGQQAQVQFDSLPGQTVRGRVLRLVQQADIAKNTLQAKVLLENPPDGLVPDMLARVRIFLDSAPTPSAAQITSAANNSANKSLEKSAVQNANGGAMQANGAGMNTGSTSRTEIAAPEIVLAQTVAATDGTRIGTVRVVVDVRDGVGRIESREVVCAQPAGEWTAVISGLRPGDFVVLPDSPATHDGEIVRMDNTAAATDGSDANAAPLSNNATSAEHTSNGDPHAKH